MTQSAPPAAAAALEEPKQWYVMRDLTRPNALRPAYKMLAEQGIACFTPMVERIVMRGGRGERCQVPFLHDLVFAYERRSVLNCLTARVPTLQFRFLRHAYKLPMTVNEADMQRFIHAVSATSSPRYYRPDEITPDMLRRPVRIVGGPLDGYEGYLLSLRGSRTRRLLIELPALLAASVEVCPAYVELL